MTKIESIVAVAVPAVAAIVLGVVGKQLIMASVELPASCLAGMVAICTGILCGVLSVVVILLVELIANQKK